MKGQVAKNSLKKASRKSYSTTFKLGVIRFAEQQGKRVAVKKYKMDESIIRQWQKQKGTIDNQPLAMKANRSSQTHYPQLEEMLLDWIADCKKRGMYILMRICYNSIKIK